MPFVVNRNPLRSLYEMLCPWRWSGDTLGCQSEATWRNEFNDRKTLRGNGYAERRIRRRPPITPQTAAKANAVDGSGTAAGGVL